MNQKLLLCESATNCTPLLLRNHYTARSNDYGEQQSSTLFHPECYNAAGKPPITNRRHMKFGPLLTEAYAASPNDEKAVV